MVMRALLLVGLTFASISARAQPMNKQDAKKRVFVSGPIVGPEVDRWLRAQEARDEHFTFRLLFTIWRSEGARGAARVAALGRHAVPPARMIELQDGRLGVPLIERLAQLCGEEPRCTVWL